jgi:hypothetical protein
MTPNKTKTKTTTTTMNISKTQQRENYLLMGVSI